MKKLIAVLCMCMLLMGASSVFAYMIGSGTVTIDDQDMNSTERLYRGGVVSTWASPKSFPGTVNELTYFETLNFTPGIYEYVRVTYTGLDYGNTFGSAYLNSFNVAQLSTNYLGDSGSSVISPGDVKFFEVLVPNGNDMILVFNSAYQDFGSVSYIVEGFTSSSVPEPASMLLLGLGLVGIAGYRKRMK